MRVIQKAKVNRASRKLMGFYRSAYDFRPPFTVVLDAGVIIAAQMRGIELKTEIPKLLGGRARLVVTRYTVKELRKRGKEAKPCVAFAERLKYVSVEARGAATSAEAAVALVERGNPQKLCVCTEDFELQKQLAKLHGVPIVRLMWHGGREQFLVAPPLERKAADPEVAPRVELDAPPPTAAPKAPPLPARTKPRRKGPKQPNPLSMRKKAKKEGGRRPADASAPASRSGAARRKRRRSGAAAGAQSAEPQSS